MLVAARRRRSGRPAPGRSESEEFMVEAAARACRNGRPLNSSINSNLKAAAAAAAAARQLRLKPEPEGHPGRDFQGTKLRLGSCRECAVTSKVSARHVRPVSRGVRRGRCPASVS